MVTLLISLNQLWSISNPHPAGQGENSTSHNWASLPTPPPLPIELRWEEFTQRKLFGENSLFPLSLITVEMLTVQLT